MKVAMKLITATNRNQWVPDTIAGEANAMQIIPNTCKIRETTVTTENSSSSSSSLTTPNY